MQQRALVHVLYRVLVAGIAWEKPPYR